MNFFLAGTDMIRWNLEVVDATRSDHVRLTMHHGRGSIVEYFASTDMALCRQQELEHLLMAARGFGSFEPIGSTR
jgi:hypothetical protein